MKKILFIAGDRSADLYGGLLCKRLKEKFPQVELFSCGGDNLAAHSKQIIDLLSHSVSGLVEVLSSLRRMLHLFHATCAHIERLKPDLIIPIDFPDFNLRLIKKVNKKYPVFYYISPQVWAWRKKRIELLRRYAEKIVVIFKFEEAFYKKEGIDVLYFGHPLLEIIPDTPTQPKNIVSFMPGSRINEVKKHLPVMMATKTLLAEKLPDYEFRIIRPNNIAESFYAPDSAQIKITPHSYQALGESRFIVASSGTATVEIAILGIPYLIIYKVNSVSWWLIKRLVKTDFAGMVNILHEKPVVTELLQKEATPERIATNVLSCLSDATRYENLKKELEKTTDILGPYGSTDKFADYIGDYLRLSS